MDPLIKFFSKIEKDDFSMAISIFSLFFSGLSLFLKYKENKPKLKFSETHIIPWNKNQLMFYSILKNPSNKDITIQNISIQYFSKFLLKKKLLFETWNKRGVPFIIKKQSNYKLEHLVYDDSLNEDEKNIEKDFLNVKSAIITFDTTYGNLKKKLRRSSGERIKFL